jgi:hypothetical protein
LSGGHVNPKPAEKEKLNPAHLIEKMKGLSHDKLKEVHDHAAAIKKAAREELDRCDKKTAMSQIRRTCRRRNSKAGPAN